jgi:D-serine deaminase-like pyridoxal phosphate-dependent protein
MVKKEQLATRVLAEVCSVYMELNEVLVNSDAIEMSRETSAIPGFGILTDQINWHVIRLSQEHGILGVLAERDVANEEDIGSEVFPPSGAGDNGALVAQSFRQSCRSDEVPKNE